MIVIYGRRSYGRVDAHGGEHAHTNFAHIYYMPLVPIGSFWVTEDLGGSVRGFKITASGKSILAAYLRMWGPFAAVVGMATGGLGGYLVAAAAIVACLYAWTWRSLGGASNLRKSDFHLLAFGTRCDPVRLPTELRLQFKAELDDKWAKLATGRPPEDVATHGAKTLDEAVVAYGLLRLAALDGHESAAVAADRLLHGQHDLPKSADGPYRGDHTPNAAVLDDVAAAARLVRPSEPEPPRVPWWAFTKRKAALVALLGLAAIGGLLEESPGLREPLHPTAAQLEWKQPSDRFVEISCAETFNTGEHVHKKELWGCDFGEATLAVVGTPDGNVVVGKLKSVFDLPGMYFDDRDEHGSPSSEHIYRVYLELKSRSEAIAAVVAAIGLLTLVLGIAGFWGFRAWKHRAA
jgi:hypothetical protein